MPSILLTLHKVHDCLTVICQAEREILSSNLLGMFKRKNHAALEEALDVAHTRLLELKSDLEALQPDRHLGMGASKVIADAERYANALVKSTAQLRLINRRLDQKAKGGSYLMTQYQADLATFQIFQDDYSRLGERLNADYRLYANEIVEADNRQT